MSIKNRLTELESVVAGFDRFSESNGLSLVTRNQVKVALDELLNNIVSYGFPDGGEHQIALAFDYDRGRLELTIIDDGVAFNPLQAGAPDIDVPLEERQIGGLGIHLVRNLMDELSYRREEGTNILTLVKHLET